MQEPEKTYLLKFIPEGFADSPSKEIVDVYIPESAAHPVLRIRMSDNKPRITKKVPVKEGDSSNHIETTIPLSPEEYAAFSTLLGKQIRKNRYYLERDGVTYEIDVFTGDLSGLILVDVEFRTEEAKDAFDMPDFCLVDVTQEKFIAGGVLSGKAYADIENDLARFNYQKILL